MLGVRTCDQTGFSPRSVPSARRSLHSSARSRGYRLPWSHQDRIEDDMRKRGLPSPDRADAMAIAFAGRANAAPMDVESHAGESITGDLVTKAW